MLQDLAKKAANDILLESMECDQSPYKEAPLCVLFDKDSELSSLLSDAFLGMRDDVISLQIEGEADHEPAIERLKELPKGSTVVVVQSTSIRLSKFRLRLELFNRGIGVAEFVHLGYLPYEQYEVFLHSLLSQRKEHTRLSGILMDALNSCEAVRVVNMDGSECVFASGMEEAKANTGIYTERPNRGGMYPVGEVFTEPRDLSQINGRLYIDMFTNDAMQVVKHEPFAVEVRDGLVQASDTYPEGFQAIFDKIVKSEDEVQIREIGLGMNKEISREHFLSDISCFERMTGLHLSLGKKHAIYREKYSKEVVQRFHIDVFPSFKEIWIDDKLIFSDGQYVV